MSDKYLRLVEGLTPPGRRYAISSPSAPRTRFILFMLAYLADDAGQVTVSLNDLAARTLYSPPLIRGALSELETDPALISITRQPSAPNTYQLLEAQLKAQQFDNVLRMGTPTVDVLTTYGLDIRSRNALRREGITTLDELAAQIAQYEREKAAQEPKVPPREFGFHEFLSVRGLGERSARLVLSTYAEWLADNGQQHVATWN